jgi:hypothetical protein
MLIFRSLAMTTVFTVSFVSCLGSPRSALADNDVEPSASTPATCPGIRRQAYYQLKRNATLPSGEVVPEYYILALMRSDEPTLSKGYQMTITGLAGVEGVKYHTGEPVLILPQAINTTYVIAMSDRHFPGFTNTESTTSARNITQVELMQTVGYLYCDTPGPADIYFKRQIGRTYTIQRSTNLVQWENIDTVFNSFYEIVWRPLAMLRSDPAPSKEFYRTGASCTTQEDCAAERLRLEESGRELREIYLN